MWLIIAVINLFAASPLLTRLLLVGNSLTDFEVAIDEQPRLFHY